MYAIHFYINLGCILLLKRRVGVMMLERWVEANL